MGASNSETGKGTKFYQLKAKVDATNNPHFGLSEKVDGKWKITNQFDTISGFLVSAEIKEREFEETKSNVFVLVMEDDSEKSQIEMTHNLLSHSIINSLASGLSLPTYNKLSQTLIQLWKKEVNGKWWGNAKVEIDGEKTSWKIDPKSAPKKEQVMINGEPFMQQGKPVYDDSKLRAFYEDIFKNDVMSKLNSQSPAKSPENSPIVENKANDSNDLPF